MATASAQIFEYAVRDLALTPFSVRWLPGSARFVVAGETSRAGGELILHELEPGQIMETARMPVQTGVKCVAVCSSLDIACGDFRGDLSIFNMHSMTPSWTASSAHSQIVNAIDTCGGDGSGCGPCEIVSGSRDGTVKLWDPRTSGAVATVGASGDGPDCWSVCFGNAHDETNRCVVSGFANGDVKMVDLRTMKVSWETHLPNGLCHLSFDRKDIVMNKLHVSCLEGQVSVYDMRTRNSVSGFASIMSSCNRSTIWGCFPLPQDRDTFCVASGDGSLSMYKYEYPIQRCVKNSEGEDVGVPGDMTAICKPMSVSSQPVVSFDWNGDKKGLCALTSFDQTVKVIVWSNLN